MSQLAGKEDLRPPMQLLMTRTAARFEAKLFKHTESSCREPGTCLGEMFANAPNLVHPLYTENKLRICFTARFPHVVTAVFLDTAINTTQSSFARRVAGLKHLCSPKPGWFGLTPISRGPLLGGELDRSI
jgi:hypothetical protein